MKSVFPNPATASSLSSAEISRSVSLLCDSSIQEESKGKFLTDLNQRGESAQELAGFASAFLGQAVRPSIERNEKHPLVELCGTGGDKASLLNISTAAMFVVAGAGGRVVKHGNRAVSSLCGSADVLEALGVELHIKPQRVSEILEQAGCVFLLASDFHPVVALMAPVRRSLAARGQMTIFNLLGPLLNPAMPEYQLAGVYRREMLPQYAKAMGLLGRRKAWAVHGQAPVGVNGGIDELTVTGRSLVVSICEGKIENFQVNPEELGLPVASSYAELTGGDAPENANRIVSILSGQERSAARDMIVLNAAAALHLAGPAGTLAEAITMACESIDSGKALASLESLRKASVSKN